MSDRTTPPFRADHVGSLLRPPELLRRARTSPTTRCPPRSCARSRTRRSAAPCGCRRRSACSSATDGEFRRASWHMDFIYQLGGISKSPGQPGGQVPQRRRRHRVHARRDAHRRQGHAREADLRRRTSSSCRASSPAPRPSSRSRRRAWSTTAAAARRSSSPSTRTWTSSGSDLTTAYADQVVAIADARLHLPAVRRHLARLPQRPQPARRDGGQGRRRRAPARGLHPPHQRGAGAAPRGHGDHHPHVPRQLPQLAGSPRAATTSSPRRCSTSSPSTASSWSGTTPAPAASSPCASCPRARSSCSAS